MRRHPRKTPAELRRPDFGMGHALAALGFPIAAAGIGLALVIRAAGGLEDGCHCGLRGFRPGGFPLANGGGHAGTAAAAVRVAPRLCGIGAHDPAAVPVRDAGAPLATGGARALDSRRSRAWRSRSTAPIPWWLRGAAGVMLAAVLLKAANDVRIVRRAFPTRGHRDLDGL